MTKKKRGLGRNLHSLMGDSLRNLVPTAGDDNTPVPSDSELRELPVEYIQRGQYQPRRDMHPEALEEMAASIKAQGVLQPIVVRPLNSGADERFEIIAGERRWRATQLAGKDTIPAIIRVIDDEAAMALALIENIQREDLNAIEQALALVRLQQEFGLTHQQISDAVGKSRTTVSNLLRLLTLPKDVQQMLEHGDIELGHAKVLLGLPGDQQSNAAHTVVNKAMTVLQTEALVRRLLTDAKPAVQKALDPDIQQLQQRLSERIGVPVTVQHNTRGKGKLVLKYNSLDELDGILRYMGDK